MRLICVGLLCCVSGVAVAQQQPTMNDMRRDRSHFMAMFAQCDLATVDLLETVAKLQAENAELRAKLPKADPKAEPDAAARP